MAVHLVPPGKLSDEELAVHLEKHAPRLPAWARGEVLEAARRLRATAPAAAVLAAAEKWSDADRGYTNMLPELREAFDVACLALHSAVDAYRAALAGKEPTA